MSRRGKRYDGEPHLNYKKVFAVIIIIALIIGIAYGVKYLLSKEKETGNKITSTTYYALYTENKWGIIDSTGKVVIPPSYQEMIKVPNRKKDVFLCTYDINNETGEYKTKALNSKNEQIFTEYDKIEAIENFDQNNNLWYEEDILKVEKDGKYGLINLAGNEILPFEYNNITPITGIKNSIKIEKEGNIGLATTEGNIVLEPTFKDIEKFGETYKDGYIIINKENKYGVTDYLGKQILPSKFDKVEQIYGKEQYVVVEDNKQKLVDQEGNIILEKGYDTIKQILKYASKGIIYEKNSKYGVMNLQGENIIENIYDDIKQAKDDTFIVKRADKYGIINTQNEIKIDFTYTKITYNQTADIYLAENEEHTTTVLDTNLNQKLQGIVSEINEEKGYLKIRTNGENKYYNFKFEEKQSKDIYTNTIYLSKKEGKYGYVNQKGEVIVDYIYDDAMEQNEAGYSAVKKDGRWGSIDANGKVVIEPTYNLENNYLIDFIGKWHLGQDINMNYYCDK